MARWSLDGCPQPERGADQEEQRGNARKALALYRRAYKRAPELDFLLQSVARLAGRAGLRAEASEDCDRLARRRPTEAQWRRAEDAERQAAMRGALNLWWILLSS